MLSLMGPACTLFLWGSPPGTMAKSDTCAPCACTRQGWSISGVHGPMPWLCRKEGSGCLRAPHSRWRRTRTRPPPRLS